MSDVSPEVARNALKDFLSLPFLIFTTTLLIGSVVMLIVLTPSRFPVHTGEKLVRFGDVTAERDALRAEHQKLLDEQSRIAQLTPTPTLNLIRGSETYDRNHMARAVMALSDVVNGFGGTVVVDFMHAKDSSISISGSVKSSQGRSTQLLVTFVDRLRESPYFSSVSEPEYRQIRDQSDQLVAPYAININLAP